MKCRIYFTLIVLTCVTGCFDFGNDEGGIFGIDEEGVKDLYVNHYKSGINTSSLCFQIKKRLENEWNEYCDDIVGLEYEWGYKYKIKVNAETINPFPLSFPSTRYTLIESLEKKRVSVDTTFDISIEHPSNIIVTDTPEIYVMYDEKELICDEVECASITSLKSQEMAMLLEFLHDEIKSSPLVLNQIKCSAPRESYRESCL